MADKSYKELSKRLGNKKKNTGNFRSYEQIQHDIQKGHTEHVDAHDKDGKNEIIRKKRRPKKISKNEPSKNDSKKDLKKASFIQLYPGIVVFAVVAALIVISVYAFTRKNAVLVMLNGQTVGHVKTKNLTEEELRQTVIARIEQDKGTKIQIDDAITVSPVHAKRKLVIDDSELVAKLVGDVTYKVEAAEISVDGNVVGIVKSLAEADRIFNEVKSKFAIEGENVKSEFVENVTAISKAVREEYITSSDVIMAELEKDVVLSEAYVVKSGDTPSKIALAHGMTLQELDDYNPNIDLTRPIQIGAELTVTQTKPFVSVQTTEIVTDEIPIEREVTQESDSTLETGKTKIINQGKDGKKEVVTEIVKINGVEVNRSQVSEKELEAPEDKVIANGTG